MSRTYRWLPLVVPISVIVACGGTEVASRWVTDGIVVDGQTEEWSGPELTYVERLSGAIGAANNDSSLYLMVRFGDPDLGREVAFGGGSVWWSPDGKKKKDIEIRFAPLFDKSHPPEESARADSARAGRRGPRGGFRHAPGAGPWDGPVEGPLHNLVTLRHEGGEKLLLNAEPGPVAAASAFHAGLHCYEVKIPLESGGVDGWAMESKPGAEVHVRLELGGVSSEEEGARGEGEGPRQGAPGGGTGPGGGMGPGGMPPGGMGGGRGGPRGIGGPGGMGRGRGPTDMMQKTEFWCAIKLAEHPEGASGAE